MQGKEATELPNTNGSGSKTHGEEFDCDHTPRFASHPRLEALGRCSDVSASDSIRLKMTSVMLVTTSKLL